LGETWEWEMALEVYPPVEVIVNLSACVAGKHFEWKKNKAVYISTVNSHIPFLWV